MDNGLRIVQGNTFATAIEIHAVDATGQQIVDWSLQDSTDLRVWYVFAGVLLCVLAVILVEKVF